MVSPIQAITISDKTSPIIGPSDTSAPQITPGSVLNVTVRENYQGQSGVFYNGNFIPAQLPNTVLDGAKLLVQVQAELNSLVLKILGENEFEPITDGDERTVSEALKALFPELPFEELPVIGNEKISNLPEEVKQFLTQLAKEPDDSNLKKVLTKLSEQNIPINPKTLKDPENAKEALADFITKNVTAKIAEAKNSIESLIKDPVPQNWTKFLEAVRSQIDSILTVKENLDLPEQLSAPHAAPLNKANLTKANTTSSKTAQQIQQLFTALSDFSSNIDAQENSLTSEIQNTISEITKGLAKLHQDKAPPQNIRLHLEKAAKQIQELTAKLAPEVGEQTKVANTLKFVDALHQLSSQNDTLKQLNSAIGLMGQPTMLVIPAIIDGYVSRWTLAMSNPEIDADGKKKKGGAEQFARVAMSIPLPGLGNVGVNIAYRSKEILLGLTVDKPELQKFLQGKMPLLDKSLKASGYEKVFLDVQAGQAVNPTPLWYAELTRRSVVA